MFIDHAAWMFFPMSGALGQCMHGIGRITAPVMCFFISEGYHYTKNLRKYFIRMGIFAFISHFAYNYCFNGGLFKNGTESMISTLFLCLFCVHIYNCPKLSGGTRLALILIAAYFADFCDWGEKAVIFTMAFELSRESRKKQLVSYALIAVLHIFPLLKLAFRFNEFALQQLYQLGVFLPIPLLLLYNGEKGGGKYTKWIFYIFYPAHLFLLGYINVKC